MLLANRHITGIVDTAMSVGMTNEAVSSEASIEVVLGNEAKR